MLQCSAELETNRWPFTPCLATSFRSVACAWPDRKFTFHTSSIITLSTSIVFHLEHLLLLEYYYDPPSLAPSLRSVASLVRTRDLA
jgi:hypothetical protein